MFEFNEFKNAVVERIREVLPVDFANAEISVGVVNKNNGLELSALTIKRPGTNICPTIHLEQFYQEYMNGDDFEMVLERIAHVRMEHDCTEDFNLDNITNFENCKNLIIPKIVGIELNESSLVQRPYTQIADLAVIYAIQLDSSESETATIAVNNQIMSMWDITTEELHNIAINNMSKLTPSTIKSLSEVMREMMLPNMLADFGGDEEAAKAMLDNIMPDDEMIYVLTNKTKISGATALLDETMMHKLVERIGDGFYILPSSIHEALIVNPGNDMPLEQLKDMVQTVNSTEVRPEEVLSDNVYIYTLKEGLQVAA